MKVRKWKGLWGALAIAFPALAVVVAQSPASVFAEEEVEVAEGRVTQLSPDRGDAPAARARGSDVSAPRACTFDGRGARRHALGGRRAMTGFWALLKRDLTLAVREGSALGTALGFYLVVVAMLPLGLGPDLKLLSRIAPGVPGRWVASSTRVRSEKTT